MQASSAEPTLPLEARNLERVAELQQLGRKKLETAAAEAGGKSNIMLGVYINADGYECSAISPSPY